MRAHKRDGGVNACSHLALAVQAVVGNKSRLLGKGLSLCRTSSCTSPFSPGIKHCLFAVLQTQCLQTLGEQIPPQHASPQPDQVIGLTYCY